MSDPPAPDGDNTERTTSTAYISPDGVPLLVESALLYVDVLGVREMAQEDADLNLRELKEALTANYRDFLFEDSPWPAAAFSDMLVLASPLGPDTSAEDAVAGLIEQAAQLQLSLTLKGFFLRGALTIGDVHIHEGMIFGEALVEAVKLEESEAATPRIILSQSASAALGLSPDDDTPDSAAATGLTARDGDGRAFVDYLGWLYDDPGSEHSADLEHHRDLTIAKLRKHLGVEKPWAKYRWVAEYHNAVVAHRDHSDSEHLIDREHVLRSFALS